MDTETWTLDELARRAGQALAADAVHAPNGRVRERPDGRAIRWYATIGLVDRPFTGPGRAARYGPRHLLQLVAVKRLQALGQSLAQIQAELTGATDTTLHRIARLPSDLAELPRDTVSPAGADMDTDTDTNVNSNPNPLPVPGGVGDPAPAAKPARFWAAPSASLAPIAVAASAASADPVGVAIAAEPAHDSKSGRDSNSAHTGEPPTVRYELVLSSTVSLTVPHLPDAADLEAIREAAAPLLHLLADRGLTTVQGVHDEF